MLCECRPGFVAPLFQECVLSAQAPRPQLAVLQATKMQPQRHQTSTPKSTPNARMRTFNYFQEVCRQWAIFTSSYVTTQGTNGTLAKQETIVFFPFEYEDWSLNTFLFQRKLPKWHCLFTVNITCLFKPTQQILGAMDMGP